MVAYLRTKKNILDSKNVVIDKTYFDPSFIRNITIPIITILKVIKLKIIWLILFYLLLASTLVFYFHDCID